MEGIHGRKSLVCFIRVLYFSDVLWRSQYALSVQNGSDLLDRKRVVFNGERGLDGFDPVFASLSWIGGEAVLSKDSAGRLPDGHDAVDDGVIHGERRLVLLAREPAFPMEALFAKRE